MSYKQDIEQLKSVVDGNKTWIEKDGDRKPVSLQTVYSLCWRKLVWAKGGAPHDRYVVSDWGRKEAERLRKATGSQAPLARRKGRNTRHSPLPC